MAPGGVTLLLALLLTACGGTPDSSDDGPLENVSVPACSEVWIDGATLPADYEGCEDDAGLAAPVVYTCDSGIGAFTTYDDRFHALLGGTITEAPADSDEYAAAYEECFAD